VSDPAFARRVLIASVLALAVVAVAMLLVRHPEVPLLLFGAILGAVFLDALARPLRRGLGAPRWLAVAVVALLLVAAVGAGAWAMGPPLYEQGSQLAERLPDLLGGVERTLSASLRPLRPSPGGDAAAPGWDGVARFVFGSLGGVFSTSLGVLGGAVAGFALSVFLALDPGRYRDGALLLLPERRRARVRGVLGAVTHALRWWLVGRAVAMAIVALLTGIGLVLLGMPLALSLALVAGVLTFVPYAGPVLAAVPAVLIALAVSVQQALLVAALYWAIQLVENYVVTPLVQGRAVSLPAALLILAQVGFGTVLGGLGLLLATPLAVAAIVLVQALYVQDVLGEPVQLLGESPGRAASEARAERRLGPLGAGR
jgi:predicted PurR-regulated permease PerM